MNRFNLVLGQGIPRRTAPKVSGMLEVIAPEDMSISLPKPKAWMESEAVNILQESILKNDGFVIEKRLPLSRHNGLGRTDAMKEQKNWQNGRLHVFGPKEEVVIEPIQTVPRIRRGKESTRRHYTPSTQILLCTANSLEKQSTLTRSSKNQNPKTIVRRHESIRRDAALPLRCHPEIHHDPQLKGDLHKLNHEVEIIGAKTKLKGEKEETSKNVEETSKNVEETSKNVENTPESEVRTDTQMSCMDKQTADEKPPDSSDEEQSGCEPEKRTAPLELMGEFLKAIMEQNYRLAKKLCQMILIYEPQNPEAMQFLPLIEQKLQLESQREADVEETDEGSTDDSEEDTSSTEDSETDSETSSEESDA